VLGQGGAIRTLRRNGTPGSEASILIIHLCTPFQHYLIKSQTAVSRPSGRASVRGTCSPGNAFEALSEHCGGSPHISTGCESICGPELLLERAKMHTRGPPNVSGPWCLGASPSSFSVCCILLSVFSVASFGRSFIDFVLCAYSWSARKTQEHAGPPSSSWAWPTLRIPTASTSIPYARRLSASTISHE
jgi:hypothetical protein